VTYSGFPEAANNKVLEKVRIDGQRNAIVKTFEFNGSEATDEITINLPPGVHSVDLYSIWRNSNGATGNRDQFLGKIKCESPEPGLSAEKAQKFSTKERYTQELLQLGHAGEVVDYAITVHNTGNVPLTLELKDLGCDEGTITGGPSGPLMRFESTTYYCQHTLTKADEQAEEYCNVARVKGESEGPTVEAESNQVCVELPDPRTNTEFGCSTFVINFTGFPNLPGNTAKIKIRIDGEIVFEEEITFNGPTDTFVYEANLPPGHHGVDSYVTWRTHGFNGGRDQTVRQGIKCEGG
jgi:hypothetical protein